MTRSWSLVHLPESSLRSKLVAVVERDRRSTASVLAYLAEFDRRELWAHEGVNSTFAFCTQRLHMSESEAYKRIWVARVARKYPDIFTMIAEGRLHLSAVIAVGALLTEENHCSVLGRIEHKSKREIERIVAELAPRPDVPSTVRALPQRKSVATVPTASSNAPSPYQAPESGELSLLLDHETTTELTLSPSPVQRAVVQPLSPKRYQIKVTVSEETHTTLRTLQDLLASQNPNGDPAFVVSRALETLLQETLKRKAALTERPRASSSSDESQTRKVPAALRRAVWKRDGGRCAFIDRNGRRCNATRAIEFHHELPFAIGGPHSESNVSLRCRAHNQHQANLDFGRAFMDEKRGARASIDLSGYRELAPERVD